MKKSKLLLRIRIICISLIACLFLLGCGEDPRSVVKAQGQLDPDKEKGILRHLKEVEWPQAYREQDTVLLDRILGDDFQMVTADGDWSNKELQMQRIKAAPMDHDHFSYEIKRLDILENGTGIIAGTGHIINDSTETIYQSSNILVKRDGIWKAVLSHVSGVSELESMHNHDLGKLPSEGDFTYLLGSWKRSNEAAGKETFEHWKKINDDLYIGLGYTMVDSDTIWKENVELGRSGDHWHYEVLGQGDSIPTPFKVTKIQANGFECFNPVNEFPKTIKYWRDGAILKVSISDGSTEIPFEFEMISN